MHPSRSKTSWTWLIIFSCCLISAHGCTSERQSNPPLDGSTHTFDIYWPPQAPESKTTSGRTPLLRGAISVDESQTKDQSSSLRIAVTITRPSDEDARGYWNSHLAFADVPWMDEVRVWDLDSQWQWPNLPFLLRRHGQERVERYGGVDPGKLVDNDFAAVLIRSFAADGTTETPGTLHQPLVSAEWRGNVAGTTDIHTLVHVARSETFEVQVGALDEHTSGLLKLWIIYADFLGSRPPAKWPREPEWAGGILTYCEIRWEKLPRASCSGTVRFLTPPAATGFDWEKWSDDPHAPARARLSDLPLESTVQQGAS